MGLFRLLATPITAPVKGLGAIVTTIHDMALEQFASPEAIRAEIIRLEGLLNDGQITEEEFEEVEDILLDRLEQIEEINSLNES